jgi:RNA recognition motif-containing protein
VRDEKGLGMNIYIGNLPFDTTEEELLQEFIAFGQVKSVSLMSDGQIGSGQSRVSGFVEMVSTVAGNNAMQHLHGMLFKGHTLTVIESLPVTKNKDNRKSGELKLIGFVRDKKRKM